MIQLFKPTYTQYDIESNPNNIIVHNYYLYHEWINEIKLYIKDIIIKYKEIYKKLNTPNHKVLPLIENASQEVIISSFNKIKVNIIQSVNEQQLDTCNVMIHQFTILYQSKYDKILIKLLQNKYKELYDNIT